MVEIDKNHVRVKSYGAGFRISIPVHKVRELGLEHDDLVDISTIKKVEEKRIS